MRVLALRGDGYLGSPTALHSNVAGRTASGGMTRMAQLQAEETTSERSF